MATKEEIMKILGINEKEYGELMEYDKKVNANEKTEFDLTDEQKKVVKSYTNTTTGKKKTVENKTKTPKVNNEKAEIISFVAEMLQNSEKGYENVTITNVNKEIEFNFNGNSYKIDLVCHRKPKT